MTKDEALKMALHTLVLWDDRCRLRVIAAIKEALAQPAQEPDIYPEEARDMGLEALAYYTAPPAAQRTWVGLTDEEVKHEWTVWRASLPRYIGFAFGIEAKLKELNT